MGNSSKHEQIFFEFKGISLSILFRSHYDKNFVLDALSKVDKEKISYQSILPVNGEVKKKYDSFWD